MSSEIRIPTSFPTAGDVAGKRVVITGGASGLGRLISGAFHEHGARVLLVGRREAPLELAAKELDSDRVLTCSADVATAEGNEKVAALAASEWGGIDVWVANAGISPVVSRVTKMDPTDWHNIVDVNLSSVFYGARAAVPQMESGGRIIVTGSVMGSRAKSGFSAYTASKAGAEALVKVLASELASDGILVNMVSPGWFDSPLAEGWMANPKLESQILDHTLLKRWGTSEEIAGPYLFLASEAASYMTGAVVAVDGGYLVP